MSVYAALLESVIGMASATNPYASIIIGAMPPDNGISMTFAGGSATETFFNKGMVQEISIVLNGKHTNQKMVFDALSNIHQALTKTKQYPGTDDFQVINIATISAPHLIGREENSQILYGSSLGVKFYWR